MSRYPIKSGVYEIVNVVNGHRYIGSTNNLRQREWSHFRLLELNKHRNQVLQRAHDKHGADAFVFNVLIYCDPDNVLFFEQKCLDIFHPEYNIAKDVQAFMRGAVFSEEHRRKIGLVHKGKIVSEESRQKMSLAKAGHTPPSTLGYHHTEETKQKMSVAHTGNKGRLGMPLTEEHKLKISEAQTGKVFSEEHKRKIGEGQPKHRNRIVSYKKG